MGVVEGDLKGRGKGKESDVREGKKGNIIGRKAGKQIQSLCYGVKGCVCDGRWKGKKRYVRQKVKGKYYRQTDRQVNKSSPCVMVLKGECGGGAGGGGDGGGGGGVVLC